MSKATALVLAAPPPESRAGEPVALTPAQARLRKMVLDSVQSPHTRRNYAKALDDLFQFCASRPLSRALLMVKAPGSRQRLLRPLSASARLRLKKKLNRRETPCLTRALS